MGRVPVDGRNPGGAKGLGTGWVPVDGSNPVVAKVLGTERVFGELMISRVVRKAFLSPRFECRFECCCEYLNI